ncbi:MAG: site-specific DNA-methyltransferase [Thiotrichales bacterium]|nr:site-specific DNA-methyltransferase [Thiotrichales bacterium]
MARRRKTTPSTTAPAGEAVTSIRYSATRKNIPPAGLESHGMVREEPPVEYHHNPHLPPVLRSSPDAAATDRLPELVATARQRPLSEEEATLLEDALRRHEPWLEWSGKRERPSFEADPVALHMHERVSTQAILRVLARQDVHRDLFADPQLDYASAVQFYRHDVDWTNRMILGDSLQVMASLARREDLAGKVQMIYIDPPYGISFKSNFQPQLGQLGVKDREQDLTREPEMVKAYRDTWTLGIHSYLAYLRDRLVMTRELLTDTGSIFVQISDANLHRVRCLLDEVFGQENACATIPFVTTSGQTSELLATTFDFLLWYAKERKFLKFRDLYKVKKVDKEGGTKYKNIELPSGERGPSGSFGNYMPEGAKIYRPSPMVSQSGGENSNFSVQFQGSVRYPRSGFWKTNQRGIDRLINSNRMVGEGRSVAYVRYLDDFPVFPISAFWDDTWGVQSRSDPKQYVVQTSSQVIERCLLMTTDPGDLVLDPTCGSGTTAYAAEQWGRRWITIDTSRVALSLAKHRLMTASFEYYQLRKLNAEDVARNPDGTWIAEVDAGGRSTGKPMTFQCEMVPHITLRSIARNVSLDPIFAKHEAILAEKLAALNRVLADVGDNLKAALADKLIRKHQEEGVSAVTDADIRRWLLPDTPPGRIKSVPARKPLKGITARQVERYRGKIPRGEWREWEVPFDTDPDWPESLRQALTAYRVAWRAKMDEVNACIAANAATEELVDKPEVVKDAVRVAGPFTIEGVIAVEDGPDSPIGGAPEALEVFDADDAGEIAVANAEAHLDKIIRLLKASGVDFHDNRNVKFSRLEPMTGAALVHAEGGWMNGADEERRVAVSIGPEVGNVTSMQVEDVIRSANRAGYDDVVFAGFGFDAAAQEAIESGSHPKLRLHMALIRPDVAMDDLLKTQLGSQLFTVFAAPRVHGPTRQESGDYVVEVEGMDVYDPVRGTLYPTDRQRIAAWFLDTDYDGRTFCICQAFFPDRSKWDRLARALGDKGVVEKDAFERLSGFESLPFPPPSRLSDGAPWRVAVKVIDPRGNEGLRVLTVRS